MRFVCTVIDCHIKRTPRSPIRNENFFYRARSSSVCVSSLSYFRWSQRHVYRWCATAHGWIITGVITTIEDTRTSCEFRFCWKVHSAGMNKQRPHNWLHYLRCTNHRTIQNHRSPRTNAFTAVTTIAFWSITIAYNEAEHDWLPNALAYTHTKIYTLHKSTRSVDIQNGLHQLACFLSLSLPSLFARNWPESKKPANNTQTNTSRAHSIAKMTRRVLLPRRQPRIRPNDLERYLQLPLFSVLILVISSCVVTFVNGGKYLPYDYIKYMISLVSSKGKKLQPTPFLLPPPPIRIHLSR